MHRKSYKIQNVCIYKTKLYNVTLYLYVYCRWCIRLLFVFIVFISGIQICTENLVKWIWTKTKYVRISFFTRVAVSANHIILLIDMYVNFTQTLSLYFFVCVNNFLLPFNILLLLFISPSLLHTVWPHSSLFFPSLLHLLLLLPSSLPVLPH